MSMFSYKVSPKSVKFMVLKCGAINISFLINSFGAKRVVKCVFNTMFLSQFHSQKCLLLSTKKKKKLVSCNKKPYCYIKHFTIWGFPTQSYIHP